MAPKSDHEHILNALSGRYAEHKTPAVNALMAAAPVPMEPITPLPATRQDIMNGNASLARELAAMRHDMAVLKDSNALLSQGLAAVQASVAEIAAAIKAQVGQSVVVPVAPSTMNDAAKGALLIWLGVVLSWVQNKLFGK